MSLTFENTDLGPSRRNPLLGYGAALAMVAVATFAAVSVEQVASPPNLSLIFVLPVVIAALSFGWGPALTAAAGGALAVNYFLIEPRYTLRVADPENIWALALLLLIAALVSAVATQARRRAMDAWQAADHANALQALARNLVAAPDRDSLVACCADALTRLFAAPTVILLEDDTGLSCAGTAGGAVLGLADMEAARWAVASRLQTRAGTYPVDEAEFDFWPVLTQQRQLVAIGIRFGDRDAGRPAAPERLVEIVGGYLSVALDRETFAKEAMNVRVQKAEDRLKTDLLAAVSHDLKTPLSTILLTLQSLQKFGDVHDAKTRADLVGLAEAETSRLSAMVINLLDVNRLAAGGLVAQPVEIEPAALVDQALRRAAPALAGHTLRSQLDQGCAAMRVDPALFESALANVLENAGIYAPPGSTISILNGQTAGYGWIEVLDEGQGFPADPAPLFERFVRGVAGDGRPAGTGLGLAIAKGFLEAQGGRVEAGNRTDGPGARVRLYAPLAKVQTP